MTAARSPLIAPLPIFAVAVALSIGWGIRGNFGHEYGAMIPGALAAITACLLSGRADWWRRVPFFGMFGALGWGFGGTISYMQVIAYTHSGHLPSQVYGFAGLWFIGFLWGALGGAGTALPAVFHRPRLTGLLQPLGWIFAFWGIYTLVLLPAIEQWGSDYAQTWSRHESPLYWFDTDWPEAVIALVALGAYDLWDRRTHQFSIVWLLLPSLIALLVPLTLGGTGIAATLSAALAAAIVFFLAGAPTFGPALYAAIGATAGFVLQTLCNFTGLSGLLHTLLVHPQGDLEKLRALAAEHNMPYEEALQSALINWPQFFQSHPHHIGWIIGLCMALLLYFKRHGHLRRDATLFAAMALGAIACLILLPTLFNFGGAGIRLTPPRGDGWACVLGALLAMLWWMRRHNAVPVVYAALVSGAIGGLGFSGAAFIKLMMVSLGNPEITTDPATIEAWQHYQNSNWHSFLEQTYGFINGIGIALTLGWLAEKKGAVSDWPRVNPRAEVWAVGFVLFLLVYVNAEKNAVEWVDKETIAAAFTAPMLDWLTLPATAWFALIFWSIAACGMLLLNRHLREPLALLPTSHLGKGQLFLLVLLWSLCVMNFERALPGFASGRLLTEGVIFLNAALLTVLILLLPRTQPWTSPSPALYNYAPPIRRALLGVAAAALLAATAFTYGVRAIYHDQPAGHATIMKRFGPDATWRTTPILKGEKHL
jgi:hypothetical protein